MKHGIYYAYWEQEWSADYVKYVHKVSDLGFDILEIGGTPLPDYSQDQIHELKAVSDTEGIELTVGYGPSAAHNVGNPLVQESALEWYRRLFDVMEQLGSTCIGGALYSYWPVDFGKPLNKAEVWKRAVDGIQKLSELAKPHNIQLNLECLNRFENYLLNTAQEGVQFVKEVDCDNVGVMLDTSHMNIEETSISSAIRTAGSLLGHFHTGECNRMVPGKGRMPWREIGNALKDIGYQKRIVMEPFVNMGGQVGQDIKIWRPICGDLSEERLDLDAKESVAFQRFMLD